jgi:hypothetical protein
MKMSTPIRVTGVILCAICLFTGWYMIAANYDYGMVAGTYEFRGAKESSVLLLKKDGSFFQKRSSNGKIDYAQGTWHRSGEGGIDFSEGFLEVGGVAPDSDGHTYGEVIKRLLDLIPSIVLGNDWDRGPRFHRVFLKSGKLE